MPAPPQFLLARALALFSPRPAFALGQKETTAGSLRACCGLFSAVCIPVFVLGGLQRGRLPLGISAPTLDGPCGRATPLPEIQGLFWHGRGKVYPCILPFNIPN